MRTKVVKATLATASIIFISLMLAGMSYAYGPENIMAMWLLDEDGGDIAGDSSENGNDGELDGGPKWIAGVFGNALELDGSNNVIIQDAPTLDTELNDGFTFVCWQRMDNPDSDGCHIFKADSYNVFNSHMLCFGAVVLSQDGTAGVIYDEETADPIEDTWQHLALVYDGSNIILYVDGEVLLEVPYDEGIADNDAPVFLGSCGPSSFISGALDEIAIFDVALEEEDIQTIMNEGLGATTGTSAVEPLGKVTTIWGVIKSQD